ncbi:MAG: TonB-dependent receptor, partial [Casimicrobiaceae bacterium]
DIVVTSVSRREQSLADAPASVYVITNEDIRRFGVTSLPEALRLAPNLQVARADTNQYAISARGFDNVLANKLLVMIDGRTVYTPLFSGTFWEAQDVMLEDIDRIEVISGPGATLWGANAVNGIINIITQSARDTQGVLLAGGAGNREAGGDARYGGALDNDGYYRVYGKTIHRNASEFPNGNTVHDASTRTQGGFRADWDTPAQIVTLQGDAYTGDIDQLPAARSIAGANVLASWSHRASDGALARVQAYYDYTYREHPGSFKETLDTVDIEAQYALRWSGIHEIVLGGGYRHARDEVTNSAAQALLPPARSLHWANVFAQDQISLRDDFDVIVGAKVETNIYTGAEFLPNVRAAWRPAAGQMLWASASRAVRSPARIDRDLYIPGKPPYFVAGNDSFASETANVYELGYRAQVGANASFTVTAFASEFDRLRSVQPQPGGAVFANGIEGTNTGVEAWGTWRVLPNWQLFGGVTALRERLHVKPGSIDLGGLPALGNDPSVQWNLRSAWDVTPEVGINVMARRIAALPNPAVPAYTAVDARLVWRPSRELEFSVSAQNLFDPRHAEWGAASNRAEIQRGYFIAFLWSP